MIAKPLISILQIISVESAIYLLSSINTFKKDEVGNNEYKNINKSENKIVKFLTKLKS